MKRNGGGKKNPLKCQIVCLVYFGSNMGVLLLGHLTDFLKNLFLASNPVQILFSFVFLFVWGFGCILSLLENSGKERMYTKGTIFKRSAKLRSKLISKDFEFCI